MLWCSLGKRCSQATWPIWPYFTNSSNTFVDTGWRHESTSFETARLDGIYLAIQLFPHTCWVEEAPPKSRRSDPRILLDKVQVWKWDTSNFWNGQPKRDTVVPDSADCFPWRRGQGGQTTTLYGYEFSFGIRQGNEPTDTSKEDIWFEGVVLATPCKFPWSQLHPTFLVWLFA